MVLGNYQKPKLVNLGVEHGACAPNNFIGAIPLIIDQLMTLAVDALILKKNSTLSSKCCNLLCAELKWILLCFCRLKFSYFSLPNASKHI